MTDGRLRLRWVYGMVTERKTARRRLCCVRQTIGQILTSKEYELFMSVPPGWLKELADAAALLMMPADILSPIGCHYTCVEETWEISLFASSTQIVGGGRDGDVRRSRFCLDLEAVRKLFDDVHNVSWQAHPLASDDELGPHVELHGTYADKDVKLRILAFPPKRFASGRRAIVYEPAWEETW